MGLVCLALFLYFWILLAAVLASWFRLDPLSTGGRIQRALWRATDPVLAPVRRVLPAPRLGGAAIDLSPIVVIIGLQLVRSVVC